MTEVIDALREYTAIAFGLLVGAIAHFGARLASDDEIGWRHVVGYTMQLGLIGLFASVTTRVMSIVDNDMRALATAILAVSANEVVQWLRRNGWLRFIPDVMGGQVSPTAAEAPAEPRQQRGEDREEYPESENPDER